jgi:hypothetical protein
VVNLPVAMPLALGCLSIVVVIPWVAARGKLHIPGYVGLAFLAFAVAFLLGRLGGVRWITGTIAGIFLSVAFFLLVAVGVGCVVALFFYRDPPEV